MPLRLCVLEQGSVESYWKMHGELFRTVEEWGNLPDGDRGRSHGWRQNRRGPDAFKACLEAGEQLAAVDELVDFAMGHRASRVRPASS